MAICIGEDSCIERGGVKDEGGVDEERAGQVEAVVVISSEEARKIRK